MGAFSACTLTAQGLKRILEGLKAPTDLVQSLAISGHKGVGSSAISGPSKNGQKTPCFEV